MKTILRFIKEPDFDGDFDLNFFGQHISGQSFKSPGPVLRFLPRSLDYISPA